MSTTGRSSTGRRAHHRDEHPEGDSTNAVSSSDTHYELQPIGSGATPSNRRDAGQPAADDEFDNVSVSSSSAGGSSWCATDEPTSLRVGSRSRRSLAVEEAASTELRRGAAVRRSRQTTPRNRNAQAAAAAASAAGGRQTVASTVASPSTDERDELLPHGQRQPTPRRRQRRAPGGLSHFASDDDDEAAMLAHQNLRDSIVIRGSSSSGANSSVGDNDHRHNHDGLSDEDTTEMVSNPHLLATSQRPLDPPPPVTFGATALLTRWARLPRTEVTFVMEQVTCSSRRAASVEGVSGVFDSGQLHVVAAPTPGLCRLMYLLLTGVESVDHGMLTANGVPLTSAAARRLIGAVPMFSAALADSSVVDNLNLAARMRLHGVYGVDAVVEDTLTLLGLGSFRHQVVGGDAAVSSDVSPASQSSPLIRLLVNVGMELVSSPMALVLRDPFARLSGHEQVEATEVLQRVAECLEIPVIAVAVDVPYCLSTRSSSGWFVALSELGTLLYGGPHRAASSFFGEVAHFAGVRSGAVGSRATSPSPPGRSLSSRPLDDEDRRSPQSPARSASPAFPANVGSCDDVDLGEVEPLPEHLYGDILDGCRRYGTTALVTAAFDRHEAGLELRAACLSAGDAAARRGAGFMLADDSVVVSGIPLEGSKVAGGDDDDDDDEAYYGRGRGALTEVPESRWRRCLAMTCGCRSSSCRCDRGCMRAAAATFTVRAVALLQYGVLLPFRRAEQALGWLGLLLLYHLCVFLAARQDEDTDGMMNKRGIAFFQLSCAVHINALFVRDDVAHRNAMVHLVRRGLYHAATCWFAMLLRLALPRTAVASIAYVVASAWFREALGLAVLVGLTTFTHSLLLAVFLLWMPNERIAQVTLGSYYAFSVLFSGFILTANTEPVWLFSVSVLRPGYGAAVANMMRGREMECDAPRVNRTQSFCSSGDDYLHAVGFNGDSDGNGAVNLVVDACICAVLLLVSLIVKTR